VVVRQHVQIAAERSDPLIITVTIAVAVVIVPLSVAIVGNNARDPHRLSAAGELPEQLVAATERIVGTGGASRRSSFLNSTR